jgi:hypothetical protein
MSYSDEDVAGYGSDGYEWDSEDEEYYRPPQRSGFSLADKIETADASKSDQLRDSFDEFMSRKKVVKIQERAPLSVQFPSELVAEIGQLHDTYRDARAGFKSDRCITITMQPFELSLAFNFCEEFFPTVSLLTEDFVTTKQEAVKEASELIKGTPPPYCVRACKRILDYLTERSDKRGLLFFPPSNLVRVE